MSQSLLAAGFQEIEDGKEERQKWLHTAISPLLLSMPMGMLLSQ